MLKRTVRYIALASLIPLLALALAQTEPTQITAAFHDAATRTLIVEFQRELPGTDLPRITDFEVLPSIYSLGDSRITLISPQAIRVDLDQHSRLPRTRTYIPGRQSPSPALIRLRDSVVEPVPIERSREQHLASSDARAYFGQLHAHTGFSDGKGRPRDAFQSARSRGLDFFAVTDHLEQLWANKKWRTLQKEAAEADAPGWFVAFHGFEWGGIPTKNGWMNHINVISPQDIFPLFKMRSMGQFYNELLRGKGGPIGQFNHPGFKRFWKYGVNNWHKLKHYESADERMSLMNVHPGTKNSEYKGYIPALDNGWRVSPEADEDNHKPNWGFLRRRTGVWAKELTRAAIIGGLRDMATFYTDDPNATILGIANGKWRMGSTLYGSGPHELEIRVADADWADRFVRIEIVTFKGQIVEKAELSPESSWRVRFQVSPPQDTYYFARAFQQDGDVLISAPFFVDL